MRSFVPILKTAAVAAVVFLIFQKVQDGGVSLPGAPKLGA